MPQPAHAHAGSRWDAGPARPCLDGTVLHLWRADADVLPSELEELLCERERERSQRLLSTSARRRWTRTRGLLRALTASYLNASPIELRFASGPHGKPGLADGRLFFNLSHSGAIALYAFSRLAPVGVDVEVAARRTMDEAAVAARVLGEQEAQRLRALSDPHVRRREFLRAWTRYEAALKCAGVGIGAAAPRGGAREPWVRQLELGLGPDVAGALACEREPAEVRCWQWRPR